MRTNADANTDGTAHVELSIVAMLLPTNDGFATSDLTEQYRFDNPVARIRITRTD